MMEIIERVPLAAAGTIYDAVELDHLLREKGRFRTRTASGLDVGFFLERGNTLAVGEILRSRCGRYLQVEGAVEPVLTARCEDWRLFSRACYNLGNRHVKLQVGERWLRITPDHVLTEMLEQLGLEVVEEEAVFVPESGAYAHGGHGHHH